ncbi:MAG TPA: hypothetical protein VL262_06615, partial [Vicinamibacterales bacterium]|nr:hypothetical protein [Vicinamibacterales bacterium]
MPAVTISRKGEQRVQAGHPWVYRSDVVGAEAVSAGDIVRVDGPRGRPLGYAFFSDRSQIVIRMIAGPHEEPSPDFWRSRIVAAA